MTDSIRKDTASAEALGMQRHSLRPHLQDGEGTCLVLSMLGADAQPSFPRLVLDGMESGTVREGPSCSAHSSAAVPPAPGRAVC